MLVVGIFVGTYEVCVSLTRYSEISKFNHSNPCPQPSGFNNLAGFLIGLSSVRVCSGFCGHGIAPATIWLHGEVGGETLAVVLRDENALAPLGRSQFTRAQL